MKAKAYSRPNVESKYKQLNREEYRLEEIYNQRQRSMAGEGGVDPRRRVEFAQGGMVQEDPRAMANLPEQAIHTEYPRFNSFYDTGPFNPPFFRQDFEV